MIGIFYGSSTGHTEEIANKIAEKLGVEKSDLHDVSSASADEVERYDFLIFGSSTWGLGDLQDDWYDFLDQLKEKDLSGKKVALFGCGDSSSYPDTFCDAIAIIKEGLGDSNGTFVGEMELAGYNIDESRAVEGDKTLGLLCDEYEPDVTDEMLNRWVELLKSA